MEKRSLFVQEIYTDCVIDAPAAEVYKIISDFPKYGRWTNELIITGETEPGGKMRVNVKTANNGNVWFRLSSVMKQNNERIIMFNNVLYSPFLFMGRHRFEIVPLSAKQTRFINAEVFSGLAVPFVREKTLLITTRKFKNSVNAALKKSAEEHTSQ
jgi:hypothetical protein